MAARDVFVGIDGTTEHWTENVGFGPFDYKYSYIAMLSRYSSAGDGNRQSLPGPNMTGEGTVHAVESALNFLKPRVVGVTGEAPRIILCGYSRGAYAVLRVAQALQLRGLEVAFLGLIDTVKCTHDSTETQLGQVIADFADLPSRAVTPIQHGPRGDIPRPMTRAEANKSRNMDLSYEVNRTSLPNWLSFGGGSFRVPANVVAGCHARRDAKIGSRTYPMGHYPLEFGGGFAEDKGFGCTHSAMGGMPFRGDLPKTITRLSEWTECRRVGEYVVAKGRKHNIFRESPRHPVLDADAPPAAWYAAPEIAGQYEAYVRSNGPDGANRPQDRAMEARWRSSVGQRPHAGKI